jgi:hypothetical protein
VSAPDRMTGVDRRCTSAGIVDKQVGGRQAVQQQAVKQGCQRLIGEQALTDAVPLQGGRNVLSRLAGGQGEQQAVSKPASTCALTGLCTTMQSTRQVAGKTVCALYCAPSLVSAHLAGNSPKHSALSAALKTYPAHAILHICWGRKP